MILPGNLSSVFDVRPSEIRPLLLLMLHSFLLGIALVVLETTSMALFLERFNAETDIPKVYIISSIVVPLTGFLYSKVEEHLSISSLLMVTLLFLSLSTVAIRIGIAATDSRWIFFTILVWFEVVDVFASLEFWGLAEHLFTVRQGKRLFGLIGAGLVGGGITGGFSVPFLVTVWGTANLLFIVATCLALCLMLLIHIIKRFGSTLSFPTEEEEDEEQENGEKPQGGFVDLIRNRYILLMFIASALSELGNYFIDYAFSDRVDVRYVDENQMAYFLGIFYGVVGITTLAIRTFLTGRLISRYGLRFGLMALPIVLTVCALSAALTGTILGTTGLFFWLIAATKLLDEVLRKSVDEPSFRILYQPLRPGQRMAAQVALESIIEPVVGGIAGVVLLLFGAVSLFSITSLPYVLLLILVVWIIVCILMQPQYSSALMQALIKRMLGGKLLSLDDGSSIAVLKEKLRSPHPGEVIHSLNLLERINHSALESFLLDLLEHPSPLVRRDVLLRLERVGSASALPAVRTRVQVEEVPQVRGAALRALCALGETEEVEQASPFLEDPHPQIKMGAMVGLLRSGGIDGVLLAGESLIFLAISPDSSQRELVARVLGEVGIRSFYRPLLKLLHDINPEVRRVALESAGKLKNPKLWPTVLANLSSYEVRSAAASALVSGGESALPELRSTFVKNGGQRGTLVRIIRICGRIRGNEVIAFLKENMDYPDQEVRYHVQVALSLCGYHANEEEVHAIEQKIRQEIADAASTLAALVDIEASEDNETEETKEDQRSGENDPLLSFPAPSHLQSPASLLKTAIVNELEQNRRQIFLLLSFIYDSQSILRARDNLSHASREKRAYALEIIDLLVPMELKTSLFPLLDEEVNSVRRLELLNPYFPQKNLGRKQRLREMLTWHEGRTSPWAKACVLYTMARLSVTEFFSEITSALDDPDPLVRETAVWILSLTNPTEHYPYIEKLTNDPSPQVARAVQRAGAHKTGEEFMLSTIEKVIILKTVVVFSETPEEVLAEVASLLREEEVKAGETIIEKGDMGKCMYIIIDGRVRVHNGEKDVAFLEERDVFGELAVLDPEPRSASVTAVTPTRLFRLDQDALYELMADRIEVARGIIHVLCQRLRDTLALSSKQDTGTNG